MLAKLLTSLALAAAFVAQSFAQPEMSVSPQAQFKTPEDAVAALLRACETNDNAAFSKLLGPLYDAESEYIDREQERENRATIFEMSKKVKRIEKRSENEAVLLLGRELWPLPLPIVRTGSQWTFDTKSGIEEVYRRRIGENELAAIDACRAYVDAQREYAEEDRDGDGVLEYAQRIRSESGKKDGLYWEVDPNSGEALSPLGPLYADADASVMSKAKESGVLMGYRYRILTAQDKHAPGGKLSYIEDGNMVLGFGLVAWPAAYGRTGIMTFVVNHFGAVYQKDLGEKTESTAGKIKRVNPDESWELVAD